MKGEVVGGGTIGMRTRTCGAAAALGDNGTRADEPTTDNAEHSITGFLVGLGERRPDPDGNSPFIPTFGFGFGEAHKWKSRVRAALRQPRPMPARLHRGRELANLCC